MSTPALAHDEPMDGPLGSSCPRSQLDLLNLRTGDRIPLRCKAHGCYICGPINARMIAWAQARSGPERVFRFSKVPTSWSEARLKIKQVRERLADLGMTGNEWAFSLEPNPSGEPMAHLHGLQHGPYIPQDVLQDVCQANGLGIPYIAAVKSHGAASYGVKAAGAAFYGVKTAKEAESRQDEYRQFLALNGGRISHHTRGFYRLPSGENVTQGEAVKAVVEDIQTQRAQAEEDQSWHVVTKGLSLQSARLRKLRALGTPMAGRPL